MNCFFKRFLEFFTFLSWNPEVSKWNTIFFTKNWYTFAQKLVKMRKKNYIRFMIATTIIICKWSFFLFFVTSRFQERQRQKQKNYQNLFNKKFSDLLQYLAFFEKLFKITFLKFEYNRMTDKNFGAFLLRKLFKKCKYVSRF